MSERTRLQIQIAEMGFLTRVAGVSLKDRVITATPLCEKETIQAVWASQKDATRASP